MLNNNNNNNNNQTSFKFSKKLGKVSIKNKKKYPMVKFLILRSTICSHFIDTKYNIILNEAISKYSPNSLMKLYKLFKSHVNGFDNEFFGITLKIAIEHNLKLEELSKYITTFEIRQGVSFISIQILSYYRNYLNARKELMLDNANLEGYSIYPSSLKLNHDLAIRDKNLLDFKKIKEILSSEEYKKNEFSKDDLMMISPNILEDIFPKMKEIDLYYKENILANLSKIYFIRKKEKIDESYITVMIKNQELVQIQGEENNYMQLLKENKNFFIGLFTFLKGNDISINPRYSSFMRKIS